MDFFHVCLRANEQARFTAEMIKMRNMYVKCALNVLKTTVILQHYLPQNVEKDNINLKTTNNNNTSDSSELQIMQRTFCSRKLAKANVKVLTCC